MGRPAIRPSSWPRIGQEVIVDFLDGDPDRPIITGRVYNADRGTTNLPFPDPRQKDTQLDKLSKLPSTASRDLPLSGIKTWSVPTNDGSGNPLPTRFRLLRFSDKRDKEQYLIRSQRRLDITALGYTLQVDLRQSAPDCRRQAEGRYHRRRLPRPHIQEL